MVFFLVYVALATTAEACPSARCTMCESKAALSVAQCDRRGMPHAPAYSHSHSPFASLGLAQTVACQHLPIVRLRHWTFPHKNAQRKTKMKYELF